MLFEPFGPTVVLTRTYDTLTPPVLIPTTWLIFDITFAAIEFLKFVGELTVMIRLLSPRVLELLNRVGASLIPEEIPTIVRLSPMLELTIAVLHLVLLEA